MNNLDPLKFAVEIAGNAIHDLDAIQTKLNALKGETIHIEIKGAEDIQRLLTLLQHQLVNDVGKNVGNAINEATKNLQKEAQDAIRTSLSNLSKDLIAVKEAIQHDNFTAFSKRIEKCAEAVNNLDNAFKNFHVTIGQDEGMKNFMTGLGEVIRNVRSTIGMLNGKDTTYQISTSELVRSVNVAEHEMKRLENLFPKTLQAINAFSEKGFNTIALERYNFEVKRIYDNLKKISENAGIHPKTGMTASQYLRTEDASRAISLLKTELGFYEKISRETEKYAASMQKAQNMSSASAAQGGVSLFGRTDKSTVETEKRIDFLIDRLKELGQAINQTMAIQSKSPSGANLKAIHQMTNEYEALKRELDVVYTSYLNISKLGDLDIGKKLGLEHLRGYTGPAIALNDVQWASMKHQAEVQEVAGEEAKRHQKKLEELTNAFAQLDAQVAKSQRIQAGDNQARQQSVAALRKQAEELVKSRMEMLRSQSLELGKLLSNGKDKLGAEQYEAVRNALRGVREEMRQIETVMQRMESYSTRSLFGIGRGSNMDYSPLISSTQKLITAKEQAAQASSRMTLAEQQLAQALNQTTQAAHGQSQMLSDLKSLATQYLGVWGGQQFLNNIIQIGGQLEMQRLSIGAILGDMAKANDLFDRIKNLAVKSPFGVVELDQMTKQLSAYGFEYDELFDMTKRLADISAATGTGVDRLALALGHVRSEAALSGYTLRQFSMANIPLAKKLSEELTRVEGKFVSVAEVRKRVRTKDIGYDQVLKVLKDLTDKGGMFYNAQEVMSQSVKARFKNLKDSMDIMYGEMAESKFGEGLKEVATLLTTLTRHWEELGAVLVTCAGYWTINRIATVANSHAMVQANLSAGRFTAAQLEMQATTGNLTRAQILQAVATKKLAVADAEAAAAVLALSRAQLQHVANTGKVAAAMNIATIATSKYTISQLRAMAVTKDMGVGATILAYLQRGWIGVSSAASSAATAAWGFMKAMWPMLALSAVAEIFMSIKRESDAFADAANYVGQSARNMMKDIDDALKSIEKSGKPTDTESLREAVNTMQSILEQNEFYTAEQQNQIDKAATLSEKYDVLLKQMKEMRKEAEWQTNSEDLINKILKNTGKRVVTNDSETYNPVTGKYEHQKHLGSQFFNNSLSENFEQLGKSNSELDTAISMLSEYQNVMQTAIEKNNGFGLSLKGKSWQEQVKLIAESGHWDKFVASVENAGSHFDGTAKNVKKASDKVRDNWDEIANDDLPAIMLTMQEHLHTNEEGVKRWAQSNQNIVRYMADGIAKALKLSEENIEKFMKFFYSLFGLEYKGKAQQKEPNEYQLQTDLGKQLITNVIKHNKNNGRGGQGVLSVKEVNKITGTGNNQLSESEVVKKLKENAQKDLQTMNDIEKLYGKTSKKYKDAKKNYEHSLNIAESNGITEDEIRTGKYKDKKDKKSDKDKDAKELRERVRILKEAADSYQYWRDKVGEKGAERHVGEEFGELLGEQGFKFENIEKFRETLQNLRLEYAKKPQSKAMLEALKELDKEISQLDRKDFEKSTEEFLSKMKNEIEELTRSWETYNSVRDATGDEKLASRLSGVEPGATAADLKRYALSAFAGRQIDFDSILGKSDEEIDKYVYSLNLADEKIKAVQEGLKDWKKAHQDLTKSDIESYAKWLGGLVDLQTIRNHHQEEYNKILEETNRLLKGGIITEEESNRRKSDAWNERVSKDWESTTMYSRLYNSSQGMAKSEFEVAYAREMDNLNKKLLDGKITAEQYAEQIEKLNQIQRELSTKGFLGIQGGMGAFLSGGYKGLIGYHRDKAADLRREGNLAEAKKEEDKANRMGKAQKAAEQVAKSFSDLAEGANMLSNLFDSMGNGSAAEATSDAAGLLGGAMQGASSLSALGPWGMAAGAALGLASGAFKLHDNAIQREIDALQDNVDALEANTESIKNARERTLGYDNNKLRQEMARDYANYKTPIGYNDALRAMYKYYSKNSSGSGYAVELANLKEEREDYIKMYNLESDKKNPSDDALDEYKKKIAELDDQIRFFAEDLAKELWGIDIQSWADQISDALTTAFENGENALDAFNDAVKSVMQSVASEMLKVGIIEPMIGKLRDNLFGENGITDADKLSADPVGESKKIISAIGEYFKPGGEGSNMVTAAQEFLYGIDNLMTQMGYSNGLRNNETSNTLSSSIQGTSEETSTLLAGYVNALRQDVSVNRILLSQFVAEAWPSYIEQVTAGFQTLGSIDSNVQAIRELLSENGALYMMIESMTSHFDGIVNGNEGVYLK